MADTTGALTRAVSNDIPHLFARSLAIETCDIGLSVSLASDTALVA